MKPNTQEKSLIPINESSIFYKITTFFKNLFYKKEKADISSTIEDNHHIENTNSRNSFVESLKIIETEETQLLNLQTQYNLGKIKEENLSKEQIDALCNLYRKQNEELKKSNESKKQRLLKLRTNN